MNGFGAAQYVSYALTETIALHARAELWRDDNNVFVAAFPGTRLFIPFQRGFPVAVNFAPGVIPPAAP